MPATVNFPKHTNPQALKAGLVLQAKPRIEENEYGLLQSTLQLLTFNENWPRLKPIRGIPVDLLKSGDDLSERLLKAYNFLGVQTSGFTRDGGEAGVCIVEVLCQGAIFVGNSVDVPGVVSPASADDPITFPFYPSDSTVDTVTVPVVVLTNETGTVTGQINAIVTYHAIDLHFEYVARDRALRARFIRNQYLQVTEAGDIEIFSTPATAPTEQPVALGDLLGFLGGSPPPSLSDGQNLLPGLKSVSLFSIPPSKNAEPVEVAATDNRIFLKIDEAGTIMKLVIDSVVIQKTGVIDLTGASDEVIAAANAPRAHWLSEVVFVGTGAQFRQEPAGRYYHVTETATIKIVPSTDWQP